MTLHHPSCAPQGVIAIARGLMPDVLVRACQGLIDGGLSSVEVTLNTPDALLSIAALTTDFAGALTVGAGTVLSIEEAAEAVDSGARFLVMPHTDEELIRAAARTGVPVFPGAMTPSEVIRAWHAGANAVKVFPAGSLGAGYIRELRAPIPDIPLMPTGGISAENAGDFVRAGASMLAVGGWLMGSGAADVVAARSRKLLDAIVEAGG